METPEIRGIKVEPLTAEAFRPFGTVLEIPSGKPDNFSDVFAMWQDLADIGVLGEKASIVYLVNKRRAFVLDIMERHKNGIEVFFPVKGQSILAVAPPSKDLPKPEDIRCFYIDGTKPYIINKDVWHWSTFPLGDEAGFFLIFKKGLPREDVEEQKMNPIPILL
ncbi:MAG TPA: hypothetical protein GX506_01065 [Firmicutes bacterium]|nr:hypothetical protein [Bacillota bacterium]